MQSTRGPLKTAHVADAYSAGIPLPSDANIVADAQAEEMRQRQAADSSNIVEFDESVVAREAGYDDLTVKVMEQSKQIEEVVKMTAQEQLERERERIAQLRGEQMEQLNQQVRELAARGDGYNGARMAHQLAKNAPGSYTIHWVVQEELESVKDMELQRSSKMYSDTGYRLGTCNIVSVDTSRVIDPVDDPTDWENFEDVRILQMSVDGYSGCKTQDIRLVFHNLVSGDASKGGFIGSHGCFNVMPQHSVSLQQKRDAGLVYLDPLIAESSRWNNRGDIEAQINDVAEGKDTETSLLLVLRDNSVELLKRISDENFVVKDRRVVHIYVQREVAQNQIVDFSEQAQLFVEMYSHLVLADKDSVAQPTKVGGLQDTWFTVSETHWNTFVRNLEHLANFNPTGEKRGVAVQTTSDLYELLSFKFAPNNHATENKLGEKLVTYPYTREQPVHPKVAAVWGRAVSKKRERFIVHGTCTFIVNK